MPVIADPDEPNEPVNPDDDIQRLLNDAKRDDIARRYGGKFLRPPHARMPPELEGEWLSLIEEFERRLQTAATVPLREIVDVPFAPPLADLPESAVENELFALIDRFAAHNVIVEFPDDVDIAEAYRFLAEELLDESVLDLRGPGTRMHIVYRGRRDAW